MDIETEKFLNISIEIYKFPYILNKQNILYHMSLLFACNLNKKYYIKYFSHEFMQYILSKEIYWYIYYLYLTSYVPEEILAAFNTIYEKYNNIYPNIIYSSIVILPYPDFKYDLLILYNNINTLLVCEDYYKEYILNSLDILINLY